MGKKPVKLRTAGISDYDALVGLWRSNGITLRAGDDRGSIGILLKRNRGLSVVATSNGRVVGAAMGAWDGRRGWIHHLAVEGAYRRMGIASALIAEVEARMRRTGVLIVKVEVYNRNRASRALFEGHGYKPYGGLGTLGKTIIDKKTPRA